MDSESLFLMVFLMAVLVILMYPLVLYAVKCTSPSRKDFFWIYRVKLYHMSVDLTESQYYGKGCTSTDKYRWMADYPTINDVAVKEIADNLNKICEGKSKTYKASMLLAFVQQNVKYTSDTEQYDRSEYWAIPIQTLTSKKGDCDDSAILYCAIAYNMGLDSRLIVVPKHAVPGVRDVRGLVSFEIGNLDYVPAESTGYIPILGLYTGDKSVKLSKEPQIPSQEFLNTLQQI